MVSIPFGVTRPPVLSLSQLQQIQEAVIQILTRIGIDIQSEKINNLVRQKSFCIKNDRVLFDRKMVMSFIDTEREKNGNAFGQAEIKQSADPFVLGVSQYPMAVHDLDTDTIVPFTCERLIEATKLIDVLSARGVKAGAPGSPTDIDPVIAPLKQYWIGATYCRHGKTPIDAKTMESVRYVIEMADALGNPIRALPVYVFSPLRLGGESLDCLLEFKDRLDSVTVSNMASLGCAAPIRPGDAHAMAMAEVIGSAIIVHEITGLPVKWAMRLCPVDLRSLSMSLGSPEDILLQLATVEVNAFFHGTKWSPGPAGMHTLAKLPDAQSVTEKSTLMTIGALLGRRFFADAGTLSLDEIFSAEQLLIDCEIKDHIERIIRSMDFDCDPELCVKDILGGLENGFAGLDTTLENYKTIYWHPKLFDRSFLASWQAGKKQTSKTRAKEMINDLLKNYDYALDPTTQKEIDKIYAKAESNLLS